MGFTPSRRRWDPRSRDTALLRTRQVTVVVAAAAACGAGLFSVVAAHAFKGHPRAQSARAPAPARAATVPGPEFVPSIDGAPSPPAAAPAPAPPPPAPAPVRSGGS